MTVKPTRPIEVFYSYSHKDQRLRDQLETQLSLLKREGLISNWHDRKVLAGEEWAREIDKHLNTADIILLLVSPDFIASDYCYDIEIKRALSRHEAGEARVIPIILRHTDWKKTPFAKLKALPRDAKPVTSWTRRDEAFFDIVQGIRKAIEDMQKSSVTATPGNTTQSPSSRKQPDILPASQEDPMLTTARILIIEDEGDISEFISTALEEEGYDTRVVSTGEEGIASIETYKPDLLLVDLYLSGGLNGLEVLRHLRNTGHDVPIILMTANPNAATYLARGFKLGADDFLNKPFDIDELYARVAARLRKNRRF